MKFFNEELKVSQDKTRIESKSNSKIQSKVEEKVVLRGRVTPGKAGISKFRETCSILENIYPIEHLGYQIFITKEIIRRQ